MDPPSNSVISCFHRLTDTPLPAREQVPPEAALHPDRRIALRTIMQASLLLSACTQTIKMPSIMVDTQRPAHDSMLYLGTAEQVPPKAASHPDRRIALRTIMRAWLPLSACILDMVVDKLPDPAEAAPERLPRLLSAPNLQHLSAESVQVQLAPAGWAQLPFCVGWKESLSLYCFVQLHNQV